MTDDEDPTITCATPAASYTADAGECYYTVRGTTLDPTSTGDNCAVASVINNYNSTATLAGAQFPVGTTTVIWIITDIHGNDETCQYDIVVTDDEDPTITCAVPAASYTADAGECYYTVPGTALDPTATGDNCAVASVINNYNSTATLAGAQFPVGTTTVIWTITDIHGNDTQCQYDIVVTDDEDPTITCAVPAASYTADAGECYYTVVGTALDPTATGDNCAVASVINNYNSTATLAGAQFPVGTTTVIWTITDIHGNDETCQYDIIVTDDEDPTITCAVPAASYTADAGECYYTVPGTALDPTATGDNCAVASVINNYNSTATLAGAQFPVGTTPVIWTITDIHGNDTQCQYDIIVTDDEDPTITCAVPAASYTADAGECYYTVPGTALDPTATGDNCAVASVINNYNSTATLAGTQFPVGTTTVIWTITDIHGNDTQCQYDIVVTDDEDPTITCATPAASYTADAGECYYTVPGTALDPTATGDNCAVASVINNYNSTATLAGAQFPVGTTTVIWTITDIHGNDTQCQYDIVVTDDEDPTITCAVPAASYTADAGECYYTVPGTALDPTATGDNCAVASVINNYNSTATLAGAQFPVGTTTVIWTITDIHGNDTQCQYDIVVTDDEDPTITCAVPAASYTADAGECYYTVVGTALDPAATGDNCAVASVINNYNSTATLAGAQFPVGTTTVIWTITDIHGNDTQCQYDIVVTDDENPTITCAVPAASYTADAGECYYTVVGTALDPTATGDNCAVASVINNYNSTATLAGAQFPVGTTTVIWTITDIHGNDTQCQYDIVVTDDEDPTITCAVPAASYTADAGECYYTVVGTALDPTATGDNCAVASVINNYNSTATLAGAQFPVGTTTVIWTITDIHGNDTQCQYDVIVTDDEDPTITCAVPAASYTADAGECYYTVPGTALDPTATGDNCAVASVINNYNSTATLAGAQFPVGTTPVIWTITDIHGNDTQCQYDIVVTDDEDPTITCATPAASYTADAGECYYTVPGTTLDPTSTGDNCAVASVINNYNSTATLAGAQFPVGTTTVIWTITDIHGNDTQCQYDIVVTDDEDPTITCPADIIDIPADAGECYATGVILGVPVTDDNCGVAGITNDAPVQFPAGVTTVTWTVTDIHGNTSTCEQLVSVIDTEFPTFTAPADITIYKDATCGYDANVTITGDVTDEADNCDTSLDADFTDVVVAGSCEGEQVITRTWSLSDDYGNTTTHDQIIRVEDNTAPTFTVPADITIYKDATCNYNASVTITGDVTDEADNCDTSLDATFTDVVVAGSCEGEQIITRTWTLTDDCGNTTTHDQIIRVEDNTAPTFTVPADITIYKDATCNYDANVSITGDVTDEADNCDTSLDATFTDAVAPGLCEGEEIITRTWTLTDDCGNPTTHIQIITVRDTTPPTFTVPADITIYKDATCGYDANVTITGDVTDEADNCDTSLDATFTDVVVAGSCEGEQIITRTWTLTDDCGNTTTHDQIITVEDNTPPTFTVPADITIYKDATCGYDASVTITGDVTDEADNCDTSLDATFTDVVVAGSCEGEQIITRTWTLTDDCGNTTTHDQIITVEDNTPPTFTVPADITIYKDATCNYDASVTITGDVTDEADNCDTSLDATLH